MLYIYLSLYLYIYKYIYINLYIYLYLYLYIYLSYYVVLNDTKQAVRPSNIDFPIKVNLLKTLKDMPNT